MGSVEMVWVGLVWDGLGWVVLEWVGWFGLRLVGYCWDGLSWVGVGCAGLLKATNYGQIVIQARILMSKTIHAIYLTIKVFF